MLSEPVIAGAISALIVSFVANFLMHWGTRLSIRRLELEVADLQTLLVKEARRRAGAASAASRAVASTIDPKDLETLQQGGATPWWDKLVERGKQQ